MIEAGNRMRNQPAPPQVILDALADPVADTGRPWFRLLQDERPPSTITRGDLTVTWSSLWPVRADARVDFHAEVETDGRGTDLRWILWLDEPLPGAALLGHLRKRLNQLINADLRYSFGQ